MREILRKCRMEKCMTQKQVADAYYMAMMDVYQNGYTMDEIMGRTNGKDD